jgi:hypothetical protein
VELLRARLTRATRLRFVLVDERRGQEAMQAIVRGLDPACKVISRLLLLLGLADESLNGSILHR